MGNPVTDVIEDLDIRIGELYALPLERFVAERDALARSLRDDARSEEAAAVSRLTKPTLAAWAVNQVVRCEPGAVEELWAAGDAVLETQERVVAGETTGGELRAALERQRNALIPLADASRGLTTPAGRFLSDQQVQAVVETLHAAAVDPSAREAAAAGRLARPLRLAGIEAARAGAARQRLAERERDDTEEETGRRERDARRRRRADAARRALVRAERDRDAARTAIADAVRSRDVVAERVAAARRELEQAEAEHAVAEEGLAARHAALERAEDAVDAARRALEDG
jgi:hypothetical protein